MFQLHKPYNFSITQSQSINKLFNGLNLNYKHQTLFGVTGSGKTFTMAGIINKAQKPIVIISHNKTLTAQIYLELKHLFPNNAVEYFVSYFDYYQPEAYIKKTDTYISKVSSINKEIERFRLAATHSIITRKDVIIVASVSCIYGLGSPEYYKNTIIEIYTNSTINLNDLSSQLKQLNYKKQKKNLKTIAQYKFHIKDKNTIYIDIPHNENALEIKTRTINNKLYYIYEINEINKDKNIIKNYKEYKVYPAYHFITPSSRINNSIELIEEDLKKQILFFNNINKPHLAERIYNRITNDIKVIKTLGYCMSMEKYCRYFFNNNIEKKPVTLFDYFNDDFLMFIDESHITLGQIYGMHNANYSRQKALVDNGFNLPSSMDNRPLRPNEFNDTIKQVIYLTATPGKKETSLSSQIVEQFIRPTGVIEPTIEIRKTTNQINEIVHEIHKRDKLDERVLITTLTKKNSESLSKFLKNEHGIKCEYIHSGHNILERNEILEKFKKGIIKCLIAINLLREGVDIPEISLVIVIDADKVGFLRSTQAIIQVTGRASRNINGKVILYANNITSAIKETLILSNKKRKIQIAFNKKHNIKPSKITKINDSFII